MKALFCCLIALLAGIVLALPSHAEPGDVYFKNNSNLPVYVWVNDIYQGFVPATTWRYACEAGFDPSGKIPDGERRKRVKGGWISAHGKAPAIRLSINRDGTGAVTVAFPNPAPAPSFWSQSAIPVIWFGLGAAGNRPTKASLRVAVVPPLEIGGDRGLPLSKATVPLVAASAAIDPIVGTVWRVTRTEVAEHFLFFHRDICSTEEVISFHEGTWFSVYRIKQPLKVFSQFDWALADHGLKYSYDHGYAQFSANFVSGTKFEGYGSAWTGTYDEYCFRVQGVLLSETSTVPKIIYTKRYLAPDSWTRPWPDAM
ncbi:MAG TPA: hypothetical protein V6C72_08475 [Chroococcales cyanobacterium]